MGILDSMTAAFRGKEEPPVYLDKECNWHPRQIDAEEWEIAFHSFTSKVFFLKDGKLGIEYNGRVIIKSIEEWIKQEDNHAT